MTAIPLSSPNLSILSPTSMSPSSSTPSSALVLDSPPSFDPFATSLRSLPIDLLNYPSSAFKSQPPPPPFDFTNSHPMVTRAKAGVFKLKLLMAIEYLTIPTTVSEAFNDRLWKQVTDDENNALLLFHTWDIVLSLFDYRVASCKWPFKLKTHADNSLPCCKA